MNSGIEKKRIDFKPTALICVVCCYFWLSEYYFTPRFLPRSWGVLGWFLQEPVFYFVIGIPFTWLVLRRNPLDLGLRIGQWRLWVPLAAGACVFLAVLIPLVCCFDSSLLAYYPQYKPARSSVGAFVLMTLASVFYMVGWEYFNRGFFTLGLSPRFGYHAAAIAMMPFFFAHFGKPPLEALGAIFGGVLMGLLAIRVKSIWPCVIVHSFMQLWMDVCAVYLFA
jgi:membrane protease YdiL (CAAX protease family)